MTLLDRYIARIVAGAFGAAMLFFLFITIVVDLLNNLSRYIEGAATQGLGGIDLAIYLGRFYLNLVPVLFTTVTPFAMVIAGMFAVARLQNANEVVPMLFVGRSIHRVLLPMLLASLLAGAAMAACWQWVVPRVGSSIVTSENLLKPNSVSLKYLVNESRGSMYVREYDPLTTTMKGVNLLVEGALPADATLTKAEGAAWDASQHDWRLSNGWLHRRVGSTIHATPQQWLERPDLTPAIVLQQSRDTIEPEMLSYTDLLDLTVSRPTRADVRLALHRHITFPLANLILLLLALPLAVFYERGSRIERLLMAIALCGGYMLLDLTCQSLGQQGQLHPIVAAWTPTIVFGALGIVLFGSTKT
ncbi:MAG TPA: LptF/LptG family permease [Planctomycetota bacterium]|nr:LptF/LptG family permease [Planctomycetota bacterium]